VAGTLVALAMPLAATLATSFNVLDIVLWGLVALVIQLATFFAATALLRGLRAMIEAGNVAAALVLIGIQLAVALLNAGAMAG
jgi:putative membrane protein